MARYNFRPNGGIRSLAATHSGPARRPASHDFATRRVRTIATQGNAPTTHRLDAAIPATAQGHRPTRALLQQCRGDATR